MPRPERPDRCDDLPAFIARFGDEPVEHPCTKISPIQDDIGDKHETDNSVPGLDHSAGAFPSLIAISSAGP